MMESVKRLPRGRSLDAALDAVSASSRNRWLLALHAETRAEGRALALAMMQDIAQRFDGQWCLYLRDGDDVKAHLMTERLWHELSRWRLHIGLPTMPRYGEDYPLVQNKPHDSRALTGEEVDDILDRLLMRLNATGPSSRSTGTAGPRGDSDNPRSRRALEEKSAAVARDR